LTGESEERETWTAESLRAASAKGKPFVRCGRGRDFGGLTFQGTSHRSSNRSEWMDLVKRVISRDQVLIQLESLILAQSERWRQA
jgi:hypothetical protein